MIRIIATIGLLVAAVLFLYWLGAFDLPISIARWWVGGHGRPLTAWAALICTHGMAAPVPTSGRDFQALLPPRAIILSSGLA